jgi:hypothetical protein
LFRDQIKELKRSLNDERDEKTNKPSAMKAVSYRKAKRARVRS